MEQNHTVIKQWSESAPYWEKHRDVIREMFAPVTQALIAEAGIREGSTVLDVATGPGEPALSIADGLGPSGKVVGVDLVPEMVEAARRESERRGLRHATFERAVAENLPFAERTFDAVVCRFGVMFFPCPADAIREWLRVLKPGGRMSLAVWNFPDKNPFFYVTSKVLERYVPAQPEPPDAPGAFRFAEAGKLKAVLQDAGAAATRERLLQFTIRPKMSKEELWALRSEMSETLRTKLATLSGQQRSELKREVLEALTPYARGNEMLFPAEVLIVSGEKR